MSLTKETINDKIEVVQMANGFPVIQVRTATIIKENNEELSRSFHRRLITPTDDTSNEPVEIASIASTVFTSDVRASYAQFVEASKVVVI